MAAAGRPAPAVGRGFSARFGMGETPAPLPWGGGGFAVFFLLFSFLPQTMGMMGPLSVYGRMGKGARGLLGAEPGRRCAAPVWGIRKVKGKQKTGGHLIKRACRFFVAEREGFEPSVRYYPTHDFQSCALDQLSHLSTQAVNGLIIQRGEGKVKIKSFALAGVSLTGRGCAGGPGRPGQQQKRAREHCQEREKDAAQAAPGLHKGFRTTFCPAPEPAPGIASLPVP